MKKLIDDLNSCFINNGNARFIDYKCAEKILNQFKKEVCEKQRHICYVSWYREKFAKIGYKGYNERYSIENAPKPD